MIRLRLAYIIPLAALALGSGLMAAPASAAQAKDWLATALTQLLGTAAAG